MKLKSIFEERKSALDRLLETKYKNNYKLLVDGKAPPLFRGATYGKLERFNANGRAFADVKARTKPRDSRSTSNFSLSYVSQSPAWKDVPDRSLSTFCTRSISEASGFGSSVWAIIPADNVDLYAATSQDFNYEVPDYMDLATDVAQEMSNSKSAIEDRAGTDPANVKVLDALKVIAKHNVVANRTDLENIKDWSKALSVLVDFVLSETKTIPGVTPISKKLKGFMGGTDFWNVIVKDMTPATVGVEIFRSYESLFSVSTSGEIWFVGDHLAIRHLDLS